MSSSTETETWPLATLTRKIRQRMQALVEDPALKPRELIMLGRLVDRLAAPRGRDGTAAIGRPKPE